MQNEKGLTFIELIFVVSIFAVMASIVLFRFDNFNSRVALNNLAQDIALRIVEAQKSAISGSLNQGILTQGVRPSYGVYFEADSSITTENTRFVYFNDLNTDKQFVPPASGQISCPSTPTAGNECISVTSMTGGEYISEICFTVGGADRCLSPGAEASISFTRPFPDATLRLKNASSVFDAERVFIEITSSKSDEVRTIAVENVGKVWVYEGAASLFGQI